MTTSVQTPTFVNPSAQAATTRPATISIAPGSAGSTVPTSPMMTNAMPITHKTIVIASTPNYQFPTPNHSQFPTSNHNSQLGRWKLGVVGSWQLGVGN